MAEQMFLLKFRQESRLWSELASYLDLRPANTKRAIQITLKEFLKFHQKNYETLAGADLLTECTQQHVTRFLADLKDRKRSPATISNRAWLLKSIFSWLVKAGYRTETPQFDAPRAADQVRPTKRIEFPKINEVLKAELKKGTAESIQAAAFFTCLFYGALRRSEALALTIADVHERDNRCILWLRHTKAQKSSEVIISNESSWIIFEWVKILKMNRYEITERLFDYSESGAYRVFKKRFGCAPHAARAAGITAALAAGAPLDAVQDFARLSSFNLVKVYDKRQKDLANSPGACLSFKKVAS